MSKTRVKATHNIMQLAMPSKDNVLNFITAFIIRQENSKANCSSWQNIKLKCQDRNKQNLVSMLVLSIARSQFSVPQHPICNFHSQSNIILDQTKMLEIKINFPVCLYTQLYNKAGSYQNSLHRDSTGHHQRNKINTIVGSAPFSTIHQKTRFRLDLCECLDTIQHF